MLSSFETKIKDKLRCSRHTLKDYYLGNITVGARPQTLSFHCQIKGVFIWKKNTSTKWGPQLSEISPYKKIQLKNQNLFIWKATRGVLWKKVFLKISQNSQENTCARVSFLIKLQAWGHPISKNTFFTEHPWTTATRK